MSAKGDIALGMKANEDLSGLRGVSDAEMTIIPFNPDSYSNTDYLNYDITKEQSEAIDRMIAGGNVKKYFDNNPSTKIKQLTPIAENVDFIERGKILVRVMDKHNFYEAEQMHDEYLKDAPIGLLTKLWISISRSLKE